jgi:hypothetical protein
LAGALQAQYYYIPVTNNPGQNPGGLNTDDEYPVGGGLTTGWTTIQASSATPAWSPSQTIPFAFNFNGAPVTNFKVSTTGILTFDVASALPAPSSASQVLPSALIPNNSVCVWGLQGTGANDNIVAKTFGTSPNRQRWIFFTSYSIPNNSSGWTYWSIVLEETSNKIYIVDQRTSGTINMSLGIQIDGSTATMVAGSPNIATLSNNDPTVLDNNYYEFIFGTQPALDLSAIDITTSPYLILGSNSIEGTLANLGSSTITSFDLVYTVDNGTPVVDNITGVSIAPLATYNFSHSIPWVSTQTGTYSVSAYASNPNGSADQNPSNDAFTKSLFILTQSVQRNPLFEVFTGSTCPPCTPGNINFHNVIDTINPDQHVFVKYQQNFPGTGDPYVTQESLNRRFFYSINSIPRMENDGGWDGNANLFTYQLYQQARGVPAQYIIDGTYTEDTIARTWSAKVRYSPLFDAAGSVLQVAILEKTTYLNVKTNGETEFYNVMKKMLPDEAGTVLPTIPAGTWDSVSVSYTFNGNYRLPVNGQAANMINHAIEHSVEEFGDLKMVGWIEKPNPPFQVFQAQNFVMTSATGIFEMSPNVSAIDIYPSPATDYTQVDITLTGSEKIRLILMDATGRTVEKRNITAAAGTTTERFELSGLSAGVYHIAVTDSRNNSFVRRIVVQ